MVHKSKVISKVAGCRSWSSYIDGQAFKWTPLPFTFKSNVWYFFRHYKGDFALARYEELKTMIKDAVSQYKELEKTIKAR